MYFTFDGETSIEYGLALHDYQYSLLPGTMDRLVHVPGRRGAYDYGVTLMPGYFTLSLSLTEDSLEDTFEAAEAVAAWLNPEHGLKVLEFSDRPDRTWLCRVTGITPATHIRTHSRFDVTFIVPDGVARGDTYETEDTGTNAGAVACPLKITITLTDAEASDIVISLNGDEKITIEGAFADEDVIVIENKHVTINGASAMARVLVTSQFFDAPVGEFEVETDSANTTVELEWTELWL